MVQWYADYLDALRDGMTNEQRAGFKRTINIGLAQEIPKATSAVI